MKNLETFQLAITELMGSLHAHEQIIDGRSEVSLENAFQLKDNLKNKKPRDFKKNYKSVPKGGESSQKRRISSLWCL